MEQTRFCPECEEDTPLSSFHKFKYRYAKYCNHCAEYHCNTYSKNYRLRNGDKVRQHERNSMLKTKYGMTNQDYEYLLNLQGGTCALCHRQDGRTNGDRLMVDHDHSKKGREAVRGLACGRCNTALGVLGDSVESIEKVLEYLKRPSPLGNSHTRKGGFND